MTAITNSVWRIVFFLLPAVVQADTASLDAFLSATPLQLEVRYCECAAVAPDGHSPDPLPAFIDAANELTVAVHMGDKSFVSSQQFRLGYAVQPAPDTANAFRFEYAGDYTTRKGRSTAQGTLILERGRWISLFGSQHGDTATSVAVRLMGTRGD